MFAKNVFGARTNSPPSTPYDERIWQSSLPRPKKIPLHSILKNSNSFNSLPVSHSTVDMSRNSSASSIRDTKCSDTILRRVHQKIYNHENVDANSSLNTCINIPPSTTPTPDSTDPDAKSYFEHHQNHTKKEIQEWNDKRDYLLKFSKHYKKEQVKDANKNFDEAFGELCAAGLLNQEDINQASTENQDLHDTTLQEGIQRNDLNSPWFSTHARSHARKVSFTDAVSSSCPQPASLLGERDTLGREKPRHSRRVSFSDNEVAQWSVKDAKDGKFDRIPSSLKKEVEIREWTIEESDSNVSSQDTVEIGVSQPERTERLSIREKIKMALGLSKNRITV